MSDNHITRISWSSNGGGYQRIRDGECLDFDDGFEHVRYPEEVRMDAIDAQLGRYERYCEGGGMLSFQTGFQKAQI